ncbi:MAG: anthranilate synthase component I family protein [Planctomycetota bacterium]|nr:MAG: anthranilate synthase component I family protein [Planctomycetota bacterium]
MTDVRLRVLAHGQLPPPDRVLSALPRACRPALLDSSNGQGWSLLAWSPDRELFGRLQPGRPVSSLPDSNRASGPATRWPLADEDPGRILDRHWSREQWLREDPEPPLAGGWIGYLGFECGHAYEPYPWLPPDPAGFPDFHFARYRQAILWRPNGEAQLVYGELPGRNSSRERKQAMAYWRQFQQAKPVCLETGRLPALPQPQIPAAAFRRQVERLRAWIGEGELFQANLAHRLMGPAPLDARALYALLRRAQPTSMSAYWEGGRPSGAGFQGGALLSWSPERFLRIHGAQLQSRPIKGTAPRSGDPETDRRTRQKLQASVKERAELTMIVDMARNDLGRLAPPGGVEVPSPGEIEVFPTLYHRTATVAASWRPEAGAASLWHATFPPASISGAPKVRALQAIAELESTGRGPYCGIFGAWEPGLPRGDFSVLIRTALVYDRMLALRVGAGIVWDSEPEAEWQETLLKARYLKAALAPAGIRRNG